MRYSEAKGIIKQLRSTGWGKIKGSSLYIKFWYREGKRYGQMINFDELKYSRLPINEVLRYYEEKADVEFLIK